MVTRRRALTGGAALGAAWLTACRSGRDDSSKVRPRATRVPLAATEDPGPPQRGGAYRIRVAGTPPLDPYANVTSRAQFQAGFTMSRLFMFKTGARPDVAYDYDIAPDLARGYESLDGGLQYTIRLDPAARFHQTPPVDGRTVTAEDIRASFERFRASPRNANRAAFGSLEEPLIERIETPDDHTAVIRLARPYAPALNLLANPSYLWIFPREVEDGYRPDRVQIGSGPFVLESVEADAEVRLVRNPRWHLGPRPHVDSISHVILPDNAQELAQFQSERLDSASLSIDERAAVEDANPKARWLTYTPATYTFIAPQLRGGSVWKDERLRRALSLAIDRTAWVDLMHAGQGGRALSALPASFGKWTVDPLGANAGPGGRWYAHDPKEARALLRAAGHDGLAFRFIYSPNAYGERFNRGAVATAKMLKDAGFEPQVVTQDFQREYIDPRGTFLGNFEGVFYGLETPFQEPHDYFFTMYHSRSRRNHSGVSDPDLDRMIDEQARSMVVAERLRRAHDLQRYLMERLYYVPLAVGDAFTALQSRVRGYHHSATYGAGAECFAQLWLDRG